MADIFISYAREDRETAKMLAQALADQGWSVWWDRRIPAGRQFHDVIEHELAAARCVIALWSKAALTSNWVREEAQDGLERKVLVPAKIEPGKSPIGFRTIQAADLIGWKGDQNHPGITQLIEDITVVLGKPPRKEPYKQTIIGFDLGHGESAFAATATWSKDPPRILDFTGRQSILTAVAIDEDHRVLLGDDAYECQGHRSLIVPLKSHDICDSWQDSLQLFTNMCFRILEDRIKIDNKTLIIVGVPSSWGMAVRKQCLSIIRKSHLNTKLRPKLRLNSREAGAVFEYAYRIPGKIEGDILIVDIGFLRTDYTILNCHVISGVTKFKEIPIEFGNAELGTFLIDNELFKLSLASLQNDGHSQDILRDSSLKARCILRCRDVKNKYFSKESNNSYIGFRVEDYLYLGNDLGELEISLSNENVRTILNDPLKNLEGQSWYECFQSNIKNIVKKYGRPALVLMTGGGSRMSFTIDICRAQFGADKVRVCSEPMTAIARGLALSGRIDNELFS